MYVEVYDSNFSKLDEDTGGASNGAGNTDGSVKITADNAGTHYVLVYPYYYNAGSGPYSIRVLPEFDEPGASWDANQEPNNWRTHAFGLQVGRSNGITSNFEARSNSYHTDAADRDYYRFEAVQGQRYVVDVFNAAKAINTSNYHVFLEVYDSDFAAVPIVEDVSGQSNGSAKC
ncbi:hypothetical protein HC891_17720 [Candidatus Gracilibacteria bacterium]|nr:hypothetical protein [Candidatus Gracilibacteria bacterium]